MKKILAFTGFYLMLSAAGFSQTKMIAHRSHSGKNHTFSSTANGNMGVYIPYEKKAETKELNKSYSSKTNANKGTVVKYKQSTSKAAQINKPSVTREKTIVTKSKTDTVKTKTTK